jgi:hypothetical protein
MLIFVTGHKAIPTIALLVVRPNALDFRNVILTDAIRFGEYGGSKNISKRLSNENGRHFKTYLT